MTHDVRRVLALEPNSRSMAKICLSACMSTQTPKEGATRFQPGADHTAFILPHSRHLQRHMLERPACTFGRPGCLGAGRGLAAWT